ncbi:epoxide hydrolase 3-like [Bidens hawaiensis]|uniref:epoxide hydrolase 3-like n=1 Tax=Bidens hawaiensis TaxID=980011 RepID=UPI00404ABD51
MDHQIKHSQLKVNGLNLHVAEIGSESSPAVVFLHGFPEIWYTWRHQMIAVANAGFRAIAPDYRGYGLSDIPTRPENTRFVDLVNDTASIVDSVNASKVFVVGKDFGTKVAYTFALLYPEKVAGIITLGAPFVHPNAPFKLTLPEGLYVRRWQEPGRAEADFARFDTKTVVRNIYVMFSRSEIPIADENQEIMDLVDPSGPLPSWFTEEDLAVYAELYQKSGFQTPLQVPYRSLGEKFESRKHDINEAKIEAPTLVIISEQDYSFKWPGMQEYVKSGAVNKHVPDLEIVYVPEGCHFVHEQFPD